MKGTIWAALVFIIGCGDNFYGAERRFEKVSDHCYYMQLKESGDNVAAVITDEGILLINPPAEPDLPVVVEALKRLTFKAVRWIVFTDYRFTHAAGARHFAQRGAILIASAPLRALSAPTPASSDLKEASTAKPERKDVTSSDILSFPWFIFSRQMRLFPAGLEIRIFALKDKALTGGDVVVIVPADKALFTGGLLETGRYPDIDRSSDGSALGWINGLKQVVEAMPVLKPAIAQAKPEVKPEQEKTLEEGIAVVPGRGDITNLQVMKDLLDVSQKLRNEISKGIKAGNSCDNVLDSPNLDSYRTYSNFYSFASRLCEALSVKKE